MITALFISLGCFGIVCAFTAWTMCAVAGRYDDEIEGNFEDLITNITPPDTPLMKAVRASRFEEDYSHEHHRIPS